WSSAHQPTRRLPLSSENSRLLIGTSRGGNFLMTTEHLETEIDQIVHGNHSDPFHILGAHAVQIPTAALAIRAFFPEALQAWVIPAGQPDSPLPMERVRPEGFFILSVEGQAPPYDYRYR